MYTLVFFFGDICSRILDQSARFNAIMEDIYLNMNWLICIAGRAARSAVRDADCSMPHTSRYCSETMPLSLLQQSNLDVV